MTSVSGSGYVIENCQTGQTKNVVFDTTSSVDIGTIFRTNYPSSNTCYSVIGTLTNFEDWDLVNLPISGTFDDCYTCVGGLNPFTASYLSVAGGGAAGNYVGGGGGGGGLVSGSLIIDPFSNYTIVVGAGGPGPTSTAYNEYNTFGPYSIQEAYQRNGSDSKIVVNSTDYTVSIGGGGGGSNIQSGSNGGSGGGAGGSRYNPTYMLSNEISGGVGTLGQGFDGADRPDATNYTYFAAGGGGGASEDGKDAYYVKTNGNSGGSGSVWLDGKPYSGGGGGSGPSRWSYSGSLPFSSPGGPGGGGKGAWYNYWPQSLDQEGQRNTGGGAGGGGFTNWYYANAVNGGSGVVKIKYEGPEIKVKGGYVSQSNGDIYHTFVNSTALELDQSFIYSSGYVLEECTTGQVLKMAWDNTSGIVLDNVLLIDTYDLKGCFVVSQSVSLSEGEWDYINMPYTSYNDCSTCITGSFKYQALVLHNCLTDETASAHYDKGVNPQPGEVWSFSLNKNDVKCFEITNDVLLTNEFILENSPLTQSITYLNQGLLGTEYWGPFVPTPTEYPWTAPTKWSDCETCVTQSIFRRGAVMVNCDDPNDTFEWTLDLLTAKSFNFASSTVRYFGPDKPNCYKYSQSLYQMPEDYDLIGITSEYDTFLNCTDCANRPI